MDTITRSIADSIAAKQAMLNNPELLQTIQQVADTMVTALRNGTVSYGAAMEAVQRMHSILRQSCRDGSTMTGRRLTRRHCIAIHRI